MNARRMQKVILFAVLLLTPTFVLSQKAIKIDVKNQWNDTGIDLTAGGTYVILSYGIYREVDSPNDPTAWIGPEGYNHCEPDASYPIPNVAARCLIGKIGSSGAPFAVGSKYYKQISQSGRLYLGVNDINFSNNDGYLLSVISKVATALDVQVDVTKDWTDTGISVSTGDAVWAIGYGKYKDVTQYGANDWIGAGGYLEKESYKGITNGRARAIIGKIGNNPPFTVGEMVKYIANTSGKLYLGIDDVTLVNNTGYAAYIVFVNPSPFNKVSNRGGIPEGFELLGNYPNPFNPETKISYKISKRAKISLKIYNIDGQLIRTLIDDEQNPGDYEIQWDGLNAEGQIVGSGIYMYQLCSDDELLTGKATLIK